MSVVESIKNVTNKVSCKDIFRPELVEGRKLLPKINLIIKGKHGRTKDM